MKTSKLFCLLFAATAGAGVAHGLEITPGAEGITLKAKAPVGSVVLEYPKIAVGDDFQKPN